MTDTRRKITLKADGEKTLEQVIEEFQNFGRIMKLSPMSLKHRENCLKKYVEVMGEDTLCKDINVKLIDKYLILLNQQYDNVTTIRTNIQVIKTFTNFCIQRGYTKTMKIPMPKPVEVIKETYSDDDLRRLLKKPSRNSFNQWKSWAICNFLLGTGCRVRTAINIQIKDLDFENQLITFTQTKNKKQQIVPMSSKLNEVLTEYLSLWNYTSDDYLFPNFQGEQMTADAFKRNVQRYNNSRGVYITSSHAYRHTYAKRWILNGGDIFRLQKLLGHSTMDMVRKYVNMYSADLQNGYDRFSPLDNISNKKTIKINKVDRK